MPKKKKDKKDKFLYFTIICFSTDTELYQPLKLIRQYLLLEQYSNIKYISDEGVEFDYSINIINKRMIKCNIFEILDLEKESQECILADSYFVLINLEESDVFDQLDLILYYLETKGRKEKKIYFEGIYMNKDNIAEENDKDSIKGFLESKIYNFEYNELNLNSTDELVNHFSKIIGDTLRDKDDNLNMTMERNEKQSRSGCCIF